MNEAAAVARHSSGRAPEPKSDRSEYLLAILAPCYRVDDETFATESALVEHLRMLKGKLAPHFDRIYLAAPAYSRDYYERNGSHLGRIKEREEGIFFVQLEDAESKPWRYWTHDVGRVWSTLRSFTRRSRVLHGGLAYDVRRPTLFLAHLAAHLDGCKSLFFVDIDYRKDAFRFWKTGLWSKRSYLTTRVFYDPLKSAQVWLAVRFCSLVLLKSAEMVRDFGGGRPNVKNFWDTAHSSEQVIDDAALEAKLARLKDADRPLSLIYFGRFVPYKGLEYAIRAVERARRISGRALALELIGTGDEKARLEALVNELGLADCVRFHEPLPYGPKLFERIRNADLLLATPRGEDTPRNAFDAMAVGVPILAFDIAYYRYLAAESEAVETSPWADVEAFADKIVELDRDRARLSQMTGRAVAFARANTQEVWLDRRVRWTLELLSSEAGTGARA